MKTYRSLQRSRGKHQPVMVRARALLVEALGPLYEVKRVVVGNQTPRFAVYFRTADEETGAPQSSIVSTGASPLDAVTGAIAAEGR